MINPNATAASVNTDYNNNETRVILTRDTRDVYNTTVKKESRRAREHTILNNFTLEKEMNNLFIILSLARDFSPPAHPPTPPIPVYATLVAKSRQKLSVPPSSTVPSPHVTQAGCSFI